MPQWNAIVIVVARPARLVDAAGSGEPLSFCPIQQNNSLRLRPLVPRLAGTGQVRYCFDRTLPLRAGLGSEVSQRGLGGEVALNI
jgi:hypothetical protein